MNTQNHCEQSSHQSNYNSPFIISHLPNYNFTFITLQTQLNQRNYITPHTHTTTLNIFPGIPFKQTITISLHRTVPWIIQPNPNIYKLNTQTYRINTQSSKCTIYINITLHLANANLTVDESTSTLESIILQQIPILRNAFFK